MYEIFQILVLLIFFFAFEASGKNKQLNLKHIIYIMFQQIQDKYQYTEINTFIKTTIYVIGKTKIGNSHRLEVFWKVGWGRGVAVYNEEILYNKFYFHYIHGIEYLSLCFSEQCQFIWYICNVCLCFQNLYSCILSLSYYYLRKIFNFWTGYTN